MAGIAGGYPLNQQSDGIEVLADGMPVHRYYHNGTTYLEATEGKEYAVRITDPTGARVAVALSVGGLNTINARHTDARSAREWVPAPYQSNFDTAGTPLRSNLTQTELLCKLTF